MSDTAQRHFEHARFLLQANRIADAEQELRACLSEEPEFAYAHALLALCLDHRGRSEDAVREAREAVALDPEFALAHYSLSVSLRSLKRLDEAHAAIDRAIELAPDDADYPAEKGAIHMLERNLQSAREQFHRALSLDADHAQSLALLATVESQLGHLGESQRLAAHAVGNSPESAYAHVSRGYAAIYSGQPRESFEAFREALRLDPNCEPAREGLLESLKMHHFFYRWMFGIFAAMNRLSAQYQWALIIGLLVGYNVLRNIARQIPQLAPFLWPVLVLYLGFCLLSWIAGPLSQFFLLFSRWGRLAMTLREKATGAIFALMFFGGLGGLVASVVLAPPAGAAPEERMISNLLLYVSFGLLLVTLPVVYAVMTTERRVSLIYAGYALVMVVLILFLQVHLAVLMLFLFQFLANHLAIRATAPRV